MAEWELFRKDTIGNSGISTAVRDRVSKTMYSFRDSLSKILSLFRNGMIKSPCSGTGYNPNMGLVSGQFEQDSVHVQ